MALYDRALLKEIKLLLDFNKVEYTPTKSKRLSVFKVTSSFIELDHQTDRRYCACGSRMDPDLDVDDPSSHENELQAEAWFLKITVRLDDD